MLWLLSKVKEITSGLDSKSNKRSNLHNALLNLTKMYQSKEETDDDFMKPFKGNLETLCAAEGAHLLCSNEIMEKGYLVLTKHRS